MPQLNSLLLVPRSILSLLSPFHSMLSSSIGTALPTTTWARGPNSTADLPSQAPPVLKPKNTPSILSRPVRPPTLAIRARAQCRVFWWGRGFLDYAGPLRETKIAQIWLSTLGLVWLGRFSCRSSKAPYLSPRVEATIRHDLEDFQITMGVPSPSTPR